MFKLRQILLAIVTAAVVVACGGGGSGSLGSSSGMTPLVATGTITGFGSIYVNGIHFQTTSATIRRNGRTVTQSQLAVGEVARIKGSKHAADNTGVADEVDVDENVIGPIGSTDTTNNVFTVLGQTVKVNGGTSFSKDIQPGDITGLKAGDLVQVDGLIDSDGAIAATRVERADAGSSFQVLGTVTGLDSTAHTFMINALTVDYSSATLSGFTGGAPSDGDFVDVQGTSFDSTSTTLTATQVTREMTDQEEAGGDDLEREGLITRFASATDFDVAGEPVTTTSSTEYRNGSAADLALNVKVEVEGTLNSLNVLVATVVAFEHNGDIELQSQASMVDTTAGTVTLLGVEVTVTASTRFEDESSAAIEMFNLRDVNVGDTIRVRGFESPAGSGKVIATRLERESPSTEVMVKGPFTAGTSPDFMVLGITIDGSAAVISDGHGGTLTLDAFLAQAVGHEVEVQGTLTGTVVSASEIAIDDHSGDEN